MPNHFTLVGLCGRDWDRVEALGKEDIDEIDLQPLQGVNLCEIVSPLPKEFEGIVATNPPCKYRHKETGEWFKDVNSPMGDDRDQWERVPLSREQIDELQSKFGATNWYDWQCNNWGTKWGTYQLTTRVLGGDGSPVLIECQTAWGPPTPATMRKINNYLREAFCLANIKWIGFDPGNGMTVDIKVAPQNSRR